MQYKRMGSNRQYRLNVPTLSGGINASTDETLIADNELVDACNVEWRGGALRTRQALVATSETPLCAFTAAEANEGRYHNVCARPFTAFGNLCTAVIVAVDGTDSGAQYALTLVRMDGTVLYTYTLKDQVEPAAMVAVPCDREQYGVPFLVFYNYSVYRPRETAPGKGILEPMPMSELYAPLVMVNGVSTDRKISNANGVMYEGYNLLSSYYRAQYTSSVPGAANQDVYTLPAPALAGSITTMEIVTEKGISTVEIPNDNVVHEVAIDEVTYKVIAGSNNIIFHPALPESTISGNVTFTVERDAGNTTLLKGNASLGVWFGGTNDRFGGTRLFLGGFGDARIVWSDVGNPLYFPENNYMIVGDPSQKITALEKQEDMLVIFKERELFATTYVQGEIDADSVAQGTNVDVTTVAAYFPLTQLSPYIGCDCPHTVAVCRNRLVWLCRDGRVYTLVTAGAYSERNVREIGQKIRPRLVADGSAALAGASAADHDGRYVLLVGSTAYTFDYSDSGFANLTSYTSEEKAAQYIAWFAQCYDGLPEDAVCRLVSDGADRAVLLTIEDVDDTFAGVTMVYTLVGDGGTDVYNVCTVAEDGTLACMRATHPIVSSLTTKAYDFGDSAAFKRIKALFLTADGDEVTVRFRPDGKTATAWRTFRSDGMQTHLIVPSVQRCGTLALSAETDKPLRVKGLRIHYTPFGTVR